MIIELMRRFQKAMPKLFRQASKERKPAQNVSLVSVRGAVIVHDGTGSIVLSPEVAELIAAAMPNAIREARSLSE